MAMTLAALGACGGGDKASSPAGYGTDSTFAATLSEDSSAALGEQRLAGIEKTKVRDPVATMVAAATAVPITQNPALSLVTATVAMISNQFASLQGNLQTAATATSPVPAAAAAPAPAPAPTPNVTVALAASPSYTQIAVENQAFKLDTPQSVRYGSGSRWLTKVVSGIGQCSNSYFGSDPAFGVVKQCEVSAGASQPVMAMAPSSNAGSNGGTTASALAVAQQSTAVDGGGPRIDTSKIPSGSAGSSSERIHQATLETSASDIGSFRITCDFSHMSFDDPIVYPGQLGKSHLHAFFGNTGTSASSTESSLASTGNSTCNGGIANRSAYWVPAMIDTGDGAPVRPRLVIVYYKTGYDGVNPSDVHPMPPGLRMISGEPNRSTPTDLPVNYTCIGPITNSGHTFNIPTDCPPGSEVWATVIFPQCWDGVNLDSPDHRSHMSFAYRGCPASHPVALPQVAFNVIYPVTSADAVKRWRLSSDAYDASKPGGYSLHGDWFNGWRPDIMQAWINNCDRASRDCRANLLGDGRELY